MRNRIIALLAGLLAACAAIESPTVRPFADHREWVLVEPLEYVIGQSGVSITVPHGFVTDFASIPQPFWSLLSPHGLYSKAAIVHDYLYWSQLCTRQQADNIFLIAMKESGVAPAQQLDIYAGVRAGGGAAWNANRDERARGLPRVIPENLLRMPPGATWAEYRKTLVVRGVKDPSFGASAPYCALGNSTAVPGAKG